MGMSFVSAATLSWVQAHESAASRVLMSDALCASQRGCKRIEPPSWRSPSALQTFQPPSLRRALAGDRDAGEESWRLVVKNTFLSVGEPRLSVSSLGFRRGAWLCTGVAASPHMAS